MPWPDGYIQARSGVRTIIVPVTIWHMLGIGLANAQASQQRLLVGRGPKSLASAPITAQRIMHLCNECIRLHNTSQVQPLLPTQELLTPRQRERYWHECLNSGTLIFV